MLLRLLSTVRDFSPNIPTLRPKGGSNFGFLGAEKFLKSERFSEGAQENCEAQQKRLAKHADSAESLKS